MLMTIYLVSLGVASVCSHGFMIDPPQRSSVWRYDSTAPINYNDNEIFCGGFHEQWDVFGGKCGVCGDSYDAPHPQPNENTGLYGRGKVLRTYISGSVIDVVVNLTSNHLGSFTFSLCKLVDPNQPESGEECFKELLLPDGSSSLPITADLKEVSLQLQLPEGQICERCVLRWQYVAGNNWGICEHGEEGKGCGPQETFRNCADIAIS